MPSIRAWLLLMPMFLALLVASSESGSPSATHGDVTELNVNNFASVVVDTSSLWFVNFYQQGCDPCKSLAPTWRELAGRLRGKVRLGQIDATTWEDIAKAWSIESYPALKIFANGAVYSYSGADFALDALASYALGGFNQTSVVSELTAEDFEKGFTDRSEPLFLKFYAPWCGHCQKLAPTWEDLGRRLHGQVSLAKVDATKEEDAAEAWGVSGFPTLILVVGSKSYRYEGKRDLNSLRAFATGGYASEGASGEDLPGSITQFSEKLGTEDFFEKLAAAGRSSVWFINFFMPGCGACKDFAPTWEAAAEQLQGEVRVGKVDVKANRELTEAWGVERFPTMTLVADRKVYEYTGPRYVEEITRFARGGYRSTNATRKLPNIYNDAVEEPESRLPVVYAFLLGGFMSLLALVGLPRCCGKSSQADAQVVQREDSSQGCREVSGGARKPRLKEKLEKKEAAVEAETAKQDVDKGSERAPDKESDSDEWVKLSKDSQ